jgi:Ser/Thr protein kinase RdoA (MazF antagonist)
MPVDLTEPRPALSAEILEVVRSRFGLQPVGTPKDLGGWFSLNVLVETVDRRYVIRVHGTQTEPPRLAAIQQVRRHLATGGIPTAEQVLTGEGGPFVSVGAHLLEVEQYVEHDADMDTWHRLELGLPSLGRTHALLQSLRVGAAGRHAPIANHIEPELALAGTLRGVARIRSWNPTLEEQDLAVSFEELARLVHDAEPETGADLPRQLVHGDFWGNNVLYLGDAVVLVADLDFMGERMRIDDLALTLFFANSTIGGERLSQERMRQMRALVDAYDGGLSDHLSLAERRALPAAIARQTLWSIGWWVPALPEERARKQVAWRAVDAEWTLGLMRNLEEWQEVFTAPRCIA